MAIKKLQNNFTTAEQSKRLLELGLPADSADCYLMRSLNTVTFYPHVLFGETYTQKDKFLNVLDYLPCWSVGRLIEIYVYLTSYEYVSIIFKKTFTPMDKILDKLEKDITNGMLDFSKLEE